MPSLSTADHSTRPPRISIPREYNAAHDLIERNLAARPEKIAYIDDNGTYTFAILAERVNRYWEERRSGCGERSPAPRPVECANEPVGRGGARKCESPKSTREHCEALCFHSLR